MPERDAIKLVEEDVNKKGGINGRPVQVIIYDNESDETKSVLAAKKLIEQDNVLGILGTSQSGTTMAIVDTVEKAGVPLISFGSSIRIVEPVKK